MECDSSSPRHAPAAAAPATPGRAAALLSPVLPHWGSQIPRPNRGVTDSAAAGRSSVRVRFGDHWRPRLCPLVRDYVTTGARGLSRPGGDKRNVCMTSPWQYSTACQCHSHVKCPKSNSLYLLCSIRLTHVFRLNRKLISSRFASRYHFSYNPLQSITIVKRLRTCPKYVPIRSAPAR